MTLTGGGLHAFLTTPPLTSIGDRVYPRRMPREPVFPLTLYRRISTPRAIAQTGPSGLASPRIQIDVWGRDHDSVDAAAEEIRIRIDGYQGDMGGVEVGSAVVVNDVDDEETDSGFVRRVLDVEITHAEAA